MLEFAPLQSIAASVVPVPYFFCLCNPAVPRLSFATRFAHIFAHIFATGNEIQKYFSARSNSFDLTENSVKAVLTWTGT